MRAFDNVRAGDKIFVGSSVGEPQTLVAELVERGTANRVTDTTAYQMLNGSSRRLLELAGPTNRVVAITGVIGAEELGETVPGGFGSYLPWTIFGTAQLMREGQLVFDVAVVQTSPPDRHGFLSLGVSVDFAYEACQQARVVVAEVNDQMPRTYGVSHVHCSRVAGLVETSRPLLESRQPSPGPTARRIAQNVLPYIPDGATVEIGVGRIMSAILEALVVRTDLGLHTGLFVEGMIPLIEAGIVSNRRKSVDQGVSTANQARGSQALYEFLNENPVVHLRPASYTHNPIVLDSMPLFRAVNSALQVDLCGRVNSEAIDGRRVSTTGGLGDFVRAARYRTDGRSIIALGATGNGGALSRIVPRLARSEDVTLTADLADVVVTEFGAVDLRAKTPEERAEALTSIAAPEHRRALQEYSQAAGQ
jgi:4-hydroxybutyrate CoA-transferase